MASSCKPFLCHPTTTTTTGTSPFSTLPISPRHHLHLRTRTLLPRSQSMIRGTAVPRSAPPLITPVTEPAKALREMLNSPGIHQGPACFDGLSAKLVQRAGFKFCFTSGFSISAARLGLPDAGFISYGEMVEQGSLITQAVSIPVIGDGDNGYGNAMNVKRTVNGFIKAGFAGIILEDQVAPKACGHTKGRKVVSREEAVIKIKAACDARHESGSDIVIVARSDSRQAVSLEEALWRSQAFAEAGADVVFVDALASRDEMKAFCEVCQSVPKMANMLEGGGKTPILNPNELEELGFKIVAYPLSLIGASMRAMEDALAAIKGGRIPPPGSLPSFDEIKDTLGFNSYYEEEKKYMVNNFKPSDDTGFSSSDDNARRRNNSEPVINILPPSVYENIGSQRVKDALSWMWSYSLRLNITARDGTQKLDIRIPAGFLEGMSNVIPGLAGVNLMEMLKDLPPADVDGDMQSGKILLDFNNAAGDRVQVSIE